MNVWQFILNSFVFLTRGVAAVVIAYLISFCLAMIFAITIGGFWLFTLSFGITGFCGVFLGALCLKRSHRFAGSFVLLLLGLAYSGDVLFQMNSSNGELFDTTQFVWLYPLGAGGLGAVCLFWIGWLKHHGVRDCKREINMHGSPSL